MSAEITIEGLEVYAVEECPTKKVLFCAPGHDWNPTDKNILVCDLVTYASLEASEESRAKVAELVKSGLRQMRIVERANQRRDKRNQRRRAQALLTAKGKRRA